MTAMRLSRRNGIGLLVALGALFAGCSGAGGGGGSITPTELKVTGRVLDDATDKGISGIAVSATTGSSSRATKTATTGTDGSFEISFTNVPAGTQITVQFTFGAGSFTGTARLLLTSPNQQEQLVTVTDAGGTFSFSAVAPSNGGTPSAAIAVLPRQFSAEANQKVTLAVTTTDITDPNVTFELVLPLALQTGGPDGGVDPNAGEFFGSLDATTGSFTAGASPVEGSRGSIVVKETTTNQRVEVPIVIVPGILEVTLNPPTVSLLAGQTATFEATPLNFFEEPVTNFLVDWRVTGGVGTVSRNGIFTGAAAGTGLVTATVGGADAGSAEVTVVGSVTGLSISPLGNPVEVEAGTTRQFQAYVSDLAGNQTKVNATWSVSAATLGTISSGGLFTAGATGQSGTVSATAQGQTAAVPVAVVALITPPTQGVRNLYGVVQNSSGPVSGVTVTATEQLPEDSMATPEVHTVTTDADGQYAFFLPAGTWRLDASQNSQAASRTVTLATQDVRVELNLTLVAQ